MTSPIPSSSWGAMPTELKFKVMDQLAAGDDRQLVSADTRTYGSPWKAEREAALARARLLVPLAHTCRSMHAVAQDWAAHDPAVSAAATARALRHAAATHRGDPRAFRLAARRLVDGVIHVGVDAAVLGVASRYATARDIDDQRDRIVAVIACLLDEVRRDDRRLRSIQLSIPAQHLGRAGALIDAVRGANTRAAGPDRAVLLELAIDGDCAELEREAAWPEATALDLKAGGATLDLGRFPNLRHLALHGYDAVAAPDYSANVQLQSVTMTNCPNLLAAPSVSALAKLRHFALSNAPQMTQEPDFSDNPELRSFALVRTGIVRAPSLHANGKVERIDLSLSSFLDEVPQVGHLQLTELKLYESTARLPGDSLAALRQRVGAALQEHHIAVPLPWRAR